VDKLWSIVPAAYVWHFVLHDRLAPGQGSSPLSPRLVVMGALATAWAARLTFNFARKGGYRMSAEDYRWPYIRERLHWFPFMLFNLTFISLYQSLLLLSLAAPAYVAWQNAGTPLNAVDAAAAALFAFFISYEAIADQQQWNFQVGKASRQRQQQRVTAAAASLTAAAAAAGDSTSGSNGRDRQNTSY
jgi:steroid 5-alpha reductase family enzyme